VVRYGGDEFLVVLFEPNDNGELQTVKERILKKLDEYNSKNPPIPISLSIGFSLWDPQKGEPIDKALDEADRNMYLEKLRYYKYIKNNISSKKHGDRNDS
jgi:FOG: GGDEF domain